MKRKYDSITFTDRGEDVVLCLPDGLSVAVPQFTVRRSAMLQDAIHASGTATQVSISMPQEWLQSVHALKAAAASETNGMDLAHNPRLLQFLRVRYSGLCCPYVFVGRQKTCGWRHSTLVLQEQRLVAQQDASFLVMLSARWI